MEREEMGWLRGIGREKDDAVGLWSDMGVSRTVGLLRLGLAQAVPGLLSSKYGGEAMVLIWFDKTVDWSGEDVMSSVIILVL